MCNTTCTDVCLISLISDPSTVGKVKKAVISVGRQPSSDTYVFGPNLHLSRKGLILSEEEQGFVWVEEAVRYYSVLPSATLLQHLPQSSSGNPLESLLLGFKALTQANFGSSVFVLGIHTMVTEYSFVCLFNNGYVHA